MTMLSLLVVVAVNALMVSARRPVHEFTINLDLPPQQRYAEVIKGELWFVCVHCAPPGPLIQVVNLAI